MRQDGNACETVWQDTRPVIFIPSGHNPDRTKVVYTNLQSDGTTNLPPTLSPLQTTSSDSRPSDACTTYPVPESEIRPLPVCNKLNNMPLPSSSLNNTGLYLIKDILEVYEHYITQKNNPATVAHILAKEAMFGTQIMEQYTPTGTKTLRALPQQGLIKIKILPYNVLLTREI